MGQVKVGSVCDKKSSFIDELLGLAPTPIEKPGAVQRLAKRNRTRIYRDAMPNLPKKLKGKLYV